MIIEQVIQSALISDSTVAGLVGDRVFLSWVEPKKTLPYINIMEISAPENQYVPVVSSRIQVSIFSRKIGEGKAVIKAINDVLKGFKGELSGVPVHYITLDNVGHLYDSEYNMHHYPVDYIVKYTKE